MIFDLHQFSVVSQSVLIGAGLLLSCAAAVAAAGWRGLARPGAFALFGAAALAAGVGARLGWMVLEPAAELSALVENPLEMLDLRRGGYSSFGALAGAALAVGLWARGVPLRKATAMLDALVPAGLLGLAVARLGCLLEGCDFGAATSAPLAVRYSASTEVFSLHLSRQLVDASQAWSAPVHPFPIYMAAGTGLIALVGLAAVRSPRLRPGTVALGSAGAYFLLRFALEWTREPATTVTLWRTGSVLHLAAILGLLVVASVAWWLRACRSQSRAPSS